MVFCTIMAISSIAFAFSSTTDKGNFGEEITDYLMRARGFKPQHSKYAGNRGIDHIFFKFDKSGEIIDILLVETKVNSSPYKPEQMSDEYIKKQIARMRMSSDVRVRKTAEQIETNISKIRKEYWRHYTEPDKKSKNFKLDEKGKIQSIKAEFNPQRIKRTLLKKEQQKALSSIIKDGKTLRTNSPIRRFSDFTNLKPQFKSLKPSVKPGSISSPALTTALTTTSANILSNKVNSVKLKTSLKAGAVTALFSGLSHTWKVCHGEEEGSEAIGLIVRDTGLSITSIYIAEGIIQRFGSGKYAITAIVKEGTSQSVKQIGAMFNYGLATFIFDESFHIYSYITGNITPDQFFKETGNSVVKAAASGTAAYCAVAIGASPGGPIVIAVSIGVYIAVSKTLNIYENYDENQHFYVSDYLGKLPLELLRRPTTWNLPARPNPWNVKGKSNPWVVQKRSNPWAVQKRSNPWN